MRVLLLEDDVVLAREIVKFLSQNEIICDNLYDGSLFESQVRLFPYDLYLLDINVPGINGIRLLEIIRKDNRLTPVIMLTAYGEIDDKIKAFGMGADDYLVKPFHLRELLVRIQAQLKRKSAPQMSPEILKIEDLTINLQDFSVSRNDENIELSPKEFKLLRLLAEAKGRVLSKQHIADQLWDYNIETTNNTIEVYINFLRKKIDRNHEVKLIHTKPGYGYYLKKE